MSPASQATLLKPRGATGARADEKEVTAVYCRPFCEPWAGNRLARFKQPLPMVDPWWTILTEACCSMPRHVCVYRVQYRNASRLRDWALRGRGWRTGGVFDLESTLGRRAAPYYRCSQRSARVVQHDQGSYSGERGAAHEWVKPRSAAAWDAHARPQKRTR